MNSLLYLSKRDVEAVGLTIGEIHGAVESAFVAKNAGQAFSAPKVAITRSAESVLQGLIGFSEPVDATGCKWVNVAQDITGCGSSSIYSTLLLNDLGSGRLRAIMHADWITGVRSAACTAVAAKYLADPDSSTIGFVGCGLQARSHLHALSFVRPTLRRVLCCSRTQASTRRFVLYCEAQGYEAIACINPHAVLANADIVITSVPDAQDFQPFLDAGWLKQTSFVGAVDLGRSWRQESWRDAFSIVVTDDVIQSRQRVESGLMLAPDRFDTELGMLIDMHQTGGNLPSGRSAILFSGIAIADIAVGVALETKAREVGFGTILEL